MHRSAQLQLSMLLTPSSGGLLSILTVYFLAYSGPERRLLSSLDPGERRQVLSLPDAIRSFNNATLLDWT